MNFNALHNILNLVGLVVAVLATFDWASVGLPAETAASLAVIFLWADKIAKIGMNVIRDGLGGLFKPQPPVVK